MPPSRDLYETLQVSRSADPIIITKAFRILAALYHPDNRESGDADLFREVVAAHEVLSDPVRRAAYDQATFGATAEPAGQRPSPATSSDAEEAGAHDERQLRDMILQALYAVRRSRPSRPGVSLATLVELCSCSIEAVQFSLWYLRGKKLIETTTDDDITITVVGVDEVESASPSSRASSTVPFAALPAANGASSSRDAATPRVPELKW